MNNTTPISRTWKFVQGNKEKDPIDHKYFIIHSFYFKDNYKITRWLYLLNIPIHLCPGNWQVQLSKIQANIILENSAKVIFYIFVSFNTLILFMPTKQFDLYSFPHILISEERGKEKP